MAKAVTEAQIHLFVEKWVGHLGLQTWDLTVSFDFSQAPETARAYIWRSSEYQEGIIYFHLDHYQHMTLDQVERLVVHELLHFVFREVEAVRSDLEEFAPSSVVKIADAHAERDIEKCIDFLASRFCELATQ